MNNKKSTRQRLSYEVREIAVAVVHFPTRMFLSVSPAETPTSGNRH